MHTTETPGSVSQLLFPKVPTWLRYAVIALLIAGIFFRFINLSQKVYWTDEALTSLRSSGHTKVEFVEEQFTGAVISPETVMRYQSLEPENGWGHTLVALMGNAEHTPLYFLGVRGWMELFGSGAGAVRGLSAVFGVLAFPCVFWLALELFQSRVAAWVSLGLFAITPLHILYAQEARPYSLWTLCIVLSSAALLRAMRVRSWQSWSIYGLSVALGLYTQLLFALVAIAHALYILGVEQVLQKRRLTDTARAYALSAGGALLSLSPWMVLLVVRSDRIHATTASLKEVTSLDHLINRWFLGLSRSLVGIDLAAANLLLVLLVGWALVVLCRQTMPRCWLLVLLLVAVPFLGLALPDVLLGGGRTIRIRYLIPSYVGLQLALVYFFTRALVTRAIAPSNRWQPWLWRGVLGAMVAIALSNTLDSANSDLWWNKSISRSAYYLPVAEMINREAKPLVIADRHPSAILAFNRRLDSHVRLQLVGDRDRFQVARGYKPVFLLNPSEKLRTVLERQGYRLKVVYRDPHAPDAEADRLWRIQRPAKAQPLQQKPASAPADLPRNAEVLSEEG
jgi:uncharacterized membrane protein